MASVNSCAKVLTSPSARRSPFGAWPVSQPPFAGRVRQVAVNGLVGARAESPVVPAIGAG